MNTVHDLDCAVTVIGHHGLLSVLAQYIARTHDLSTVIKEEGEYLKRFLYHDLSLNIS
jgi:hypothetical protein